MIPTIWKKTLAINTTNTSYGADLTLKSNTDVMTAPWLPVAQQFLAIHFFGAGADNNTAKARILGAAQNANGDGWIVTPLAAFSLTLSQDVGAAGQIVIDTDRYADTIALDTGTGASSIRVLSPTGNVRGLVLMDVMESQYVCIDHITNGSATNVNSLYRFLRGGMGVPVIQA